MYSANSSSLVFIIMFLTFIVRVKYNASIIGKTANPKALEDALLIIPTISIETNKAILIEVAIILVLIFFLLN